METNLSRNYKIQVFEMSKVKDHTCSLSFFTYHLKEHQKNFQDEICAVQNIAVNHDIK